MNNNKEWYVILNMNCDYEICRMGPKSGLFKGSYEECENWIKEKQKEESKTLALEELGKVKTVKVYHQAYVDKQQKRITELEKENAELKETNEKLRHDFGEGYIQDEKEFWEKTSYLEGQLAKAKDLLTKVMEKTWSIDYFVVDEINAFLKSEVEK